MLENPSFNKLDADKMADALMIKLAELAETEDLDTSLQSFRAKNQEIEYPSDENQIKTANETDCQ